MGEREDREGRDLVAWLVIGHFVLLMMIATRSYYDVYQLQKCKEATGLQCHLAAVPISPKEPQ